MARSGGVRNGLTSVDQTDAELKAITAGSAKNVGISRNFRDQISLLVLQMVREANVHAFVLEGKAMPSRIERRPA